MNSVWRSLLLVTVGLPLLLLLAGSPEVVGAPILGPFGGSMLQVKVHVSPAANNNNPVAVDLVLVSNKKLLKELMKMSARDWFENRHQVQLDYPKETDLNAGSWEWVPGQAVRPYSLPVKRGIVGGVIFANYFTQGAHRALIDPRKGILITLGDDDLCVQLDKEVAKPCPVRLFAHVKAINDAGESLKNYREIEESFNRELAGGFPFAYLGDQPTQPQLYPLAMIKFFRVLDDKEKAARDALNRSSEFGVSAEQATAATAFLDQIDQVGEFFRPFLETKQGPAFDFKVQLRVVPDREQEIGGEQIIDWKLEVGKKKFSYLSDDLTGHWIFGDPIRLSLRWANDSPSRPVASAVPLPFTVKDRTAVFEYNDSWSLFTFLLRHGPLLQRAGAQRECDQGFEADTYALKFTIKTEPDPAGLPSQRPDLKLSPAKVFLRLSLVTANKQEPLLLPCFPIEAPKVDVPIKTN